MEASRPTAKFKDASMILPLNPSFWTNGSFPALWTNGMLKSPVVRSRCVSQDQNDLQNLVFDVYPNVQEIQDDILVGHGLVPSLLSESPSHRSRRPPVVVQHHLRARSVGTPPARTFSDDYVLTRPMFRTDRSSVWECVHRRTGQVFCVKIIVREEGEVQRLRAAQCHPNICRVYDCIYEINKCHLIMEWYDGGNMFTYIVQNGPLSEDVAIPMIRQILHGVQYLHNNKGMAHGGLLPDNILLHGPNNAIVIVDFGCFDIPQKKVDHHTFAADMYSVGALVHFMLLGDSVEDLFHWEGLSRSAKQFLTLLLHNDPTVRLTAQEALLHEFVTTNDKEQNVAVAARSLRKFWRVDKHIIGFSTCSNTTLLSSSSTSSSSVQSS